MAGLRSRHDFPQRMTADVSELLDWVPCSMEGRHAPTKTRARAKALRQR